MTTTASSLREIKHGTVPDGQYDGRWSGYTVQFSHDGRLFEAVTDIGVRGQNVACRVIVESGRVRVEAI